MMHKWLDAAKSVWVRLEINMSGQGNKDAPSHAC